MPSNRPLPSSSGDNVSMMKTSGWLLKIKTLRVSLRVGLTYSACSSLSLFGSCSSLLELLPWRELSFSSTKALQPSMNELLFPPQPDSSVTPLAWAQSYPASWPEQSAVQGYPWNVCAELAVDNAMKSRSVNRRVFIVSAITSYLRANSVTEVWHLMTVIFAGFMVCMAAFWIGSPAVRWSDDGGWNKRRDDEERYCG